MIKARCYSDDRAIEVCFDATPWFEQSLPEYIDELRDCGWGGNYPADAVALYFSESNADVHDMFRYIEIRNKIETIGFECHIDAEDAEIWMKEHGMDLIDSDND
jgi:hypothetical protein